VGACDRRPHLHIDHNAIALADNAPHVSMRPMRDLIVTQNITVDGVIEGDFFVLAGESSDASDVDDALRRQRERADALVLGRNTFEAFRSFWPHQTDDPSGTSDYLNSVAKYVVSRSLDADDLGWANSTVLRTIEDVGRLKTLDGADIVTTGSISLVHGLIAAGIVDEYRLFTYPVVLGQGRRLFTDTRAELDLMEAVGFRSGVSLAVYRQRQAT
jgi:dihydrofolate reductase